MNKINLNYEWLSLVEREQGEAVKAATEELKLWAKKPGLMRKVADEADMLGRIIWVIMPEEENEPSSYRESLGGALLPNEVTLGQHLAEMWPSEGQALIYVVQIWLDIRVEVLAKIDELFNKHGLLGIWCAIRREGYRLLRGAWDIPVEKEHKKVRQLLVIKAPLW